MDKRVSLLLAGPGDQARQWYKRLSSDPRFDVHSCANTVNDLQRKLETRRPEGLLVDAQLFAGPNGLREILESFPGVIAFVILPPHAAEGVTADIRSIPSVVAGFPPDTPLSELAAEVHEMLVNTRQVFGALMSEREATSASLDPPLQPATTAPPPPRPGGGRVVAFWSGPAGGTGCTTMALAISALAARRGIGVVLLALAEPAVCSYLNLHRVPNIASFFTATDDNLQAATQTVEWGGREARANLQVVLGPMRPRDGKTITGMELSAVIETTRGRCQYVVVDVPSLTPSATGVWTHTPLKHASDIVLVTAPTVTGISAAVEALSTLHDIPAAGQVSVLLNQRTPDGAFSTREFRSAVDNTLHECPEVVRVDYAPDLPGAMNEGQMPDSAILGDGLQKLGHLVGLPGPQTVAPKGRGRLRIGKLRISLG